MGLCGEDLTFTAINLWMMSVSPDQISFVLLCSFAFNCMMFGVKLPEVLRLVRLVLRKMRTQKALEEGERGREELVAARGRRRSSVSPVGAGAAANKEEDAGSVRGDDEAAMLRKALAEKDVTIAELRAALEAARSGARAQVVLAEECSYA